MSTLRNSPVTIQQWVDTLPPSEEPAASPSPSLYSPQTQHQRKYITRDSSFQSDDGSSHCSSVESVLEQRKPDPETVLLELGFGPRRNSSSVSRIPARFLQPSKVSQKLLTQIDIDKFLEQYGEYKYPEHQSSPGSPAKTRPKTY